MLSPTPVGLCSGRVASSDSRFHCRALFCPPMRRSLLPLAASAIVIMVTCEGGRAVVCLTHIRAYTTGPTVETFLVVPTKMWLQ